MREQPSSVACVQNHSGEDQANLCTMRRPLDPKEFQRVSDRLGYDGPMTALLHVTDLHIRFGASHAVRGIGFHLDEGEVLGLVGESRSGKSATSLAIMGLLHPAAQA